jgi:hypothetical protein
VPARPAVRSQVLDAWPKLPDGRLDLTRAPLRLLAVVNRLDLRKTSAGSAGEGRFVFGVLDAGGNPTQFTVILEYNLPAASGDEVRAWAERWHALGALDPATEGYRAALQAVTDAFAGPGAAPGRPNGSAINQVRTNEIALAAPWELREFGLNEAGQLAERTVAVTPDASFNGAAALATFVNANEAAVLSEQHDVPLQADGAPFRAGAIVNNVDFWSAPGIANNEARHKFSLNTCNGCHGAETSTAFLHVSPRAADQEAALSGFLTGSTVQDPVGGEGRTFNDLARRVESTKTVLCASQPALLEAVPPIARAH